MSDGEPVGDYQYPPSDEGGLDQCVRCGEVFGGERASSGVNLTSGPVVGAESGREYDVVIDSPPGTRLMHPGCYKDHEAERHADENHSLGEFL